MGKPKIAKVVMQSDQDPYSTITIFLAQEDGNGAWGPLDNATKGVLEGQFFRISFTSGSAYPDNAVLACGRFEPANNQGQTYLEGQIDGQGPVSRVLCSKVIFNKYARLEGSINCETAPHLPLSSISINGQVSVYASNNTSNPIGDRDKELECLWGGNIVFEYQDITNL